MTIYDLQPQEIWQNFLLLTQVPRPSGHLKKVQDFLLRWAEERGIEAFKDNGENIVMRKPATPDRENCPTVCLQAHMDMVPQKAPESNHNFETDPIVSWLDGVWLRARQPTLGADDGIGVAAIMAIMESRDVQHGPLEALITADEETCMYGVNHLSPDTLKGDILLNIDNENMGEFIIGSAGGVNISAYMKYQEVATDPEDVAMRVSISGLTGGHSGLEINSGRANANILLSRIVRQAILDDEARLASWNGGNMRNAIPRAAQAVLTLPRENAADLQELCQYCQDLFTEEYRGVETGIEVTMEPVELPSTEVPEEIQDNLVSAIMACHNGVLRFIPSIPSVVETSSNLAIINIGGGDAEVLILARSSQDSQLEFLQEKMECNFGMAGMKVEFSGQYGSWQPNFDSPIAAKMVEVYRRCFGEEARVEVCHAGLECSLIGEVYPKMDLISFGPTIRSPHTSEEKCHIPSVDKFWTFLKALLASIG